MIYKYVYHIFLSNRKLHFLLLKKAIIAVVFEIFSFHSKTQIGTNKWRLRRFVQILDIFLNYFNKFKFFIISRKLKIKNERR